MTSSCVRDVDSIRSVAEFVRLLIWANSSNLDFFSTVKNVNKKSAKNLDARVLLTSFQSWISCGIPSIACFLSSNLFLIVLSQIFPLTFCPTPVPFTRNPCSFLFCILVSVPLTVKGNSSSTPCALASFTSSPCNRNE